MDDVAGDDLAGVDAGSVLEPHAPALSSRSLSRSRASFISAGGPDRAQRVVLVQRGEAEHGHDGVADVLLQRPAMALEDGAHRGEVDVQDLAERLCVELLAEVVDPLRSLKTTVTVLRTS